MNKNNEVKRVWVRRIHTLKGNSPYFLNKVLNINLSVNKSQKYEKIIRS